LSIINGVFSTNEVNFPIDTLKCTNFWNSLKSKSNKMTQGARKSTTNILKSKSNKMTQGSRKSTTNILKSKSNNMTQGARKLIF
jgi:hypothetical protein